MISHSAMSARIGCFKYACGLRAEEVSLLPAAILFSFATFALLGFLERTRTGLQHFK